MEPDRLPKEIASLTPEQRALLMLRLKNRAISREQEPAATPIKPVDRRGDLPLSFAQQRLWFLDQIQPGSSFYNMFTSVRLSGPLDLAALSRSLSEIARRHEALRTRFPTVDGQPRQVIDPARPIRPSLCDLSGLPAPLREPMIRTLLLAAVRRPFDLARGPLMRIGLLRLAEREHVLFQTTHHIISDGWSGGVFVREVAPLYEAFSNGDPSPLPDPPIQYADFAVWQREWLSGEVLENQLAYWRKQLANLTVLELPTDHPRPLTQRFRGSLMGVVAPARLSPALAALSQSEGSTLFMTLLSAFQTLLARYSGQRDIVVGSSIANRNRVQIQNLIGFFANTLVLRGDLSGDPTFRELLRRIRETCLGAYAHQDVPFEKLVEELRPERDLSRHPLFQVACVLQNTPRSAPVVSGVTLSPLYVESDTAKFDLTLTAAEGPDGLVLSIEYNTDLFTAPTIRRLLHHLENLLAGVAAAPDRRISALALLTAAEQQQIVAEWNDTRTGVRSQEASGAACFHELVAAQAAQTPDAVAIVFVPETTNDDPSSSSLRPSSPVQVTYGELDRRANQLAQYLRMFGVGAEARVGLCLDRSAELVIALLGVLKAGSAYVPLDPAYPIERLAFMIEDARLALLLTQAALSDRLPAHNAHEIALDDDWPMIEAMPNDPPAGSPHPDNLAYVIYTSGSTGRPKGVLVAHRGLRNLSDAQRRVFGARADDRALQFASFSFDAAIFEIALALRAGAPICLAEATALLPGPPLARLLRDQRITAATLPPSALAALPEIALPALRTLIVAGEACPAEIAERWSAGRRMFNAYGPTETTVWATVARAGAGAPPIGRPIANAQSYVLDRAMRPAPIGVPGELYLGGSGLARGYLARPDLTAAAFVPDPFSKGPGVRGQGADPDPRSPIPEPRLYRTGDLARLRPDGQVEFLGRIDHQIKLRGYRIELGEIEAALAQRPSVQECAVVARADATGDLRIAAYVVPRRGSEVRDQGSGDAAVDNLIPDPRSLIPELRGWLGERLPAYMVPSAFVELEALPRTPAGKIDRAALPAPGQRRAPAEAALQPPRTPLELQIAAIWREVLQIEQVGVNDNFFDLGGHSLRMVDVQGRLAAQIGREIPVLDLFRYPTIGALAAFLRDEADADAPATDASEPPAARDSAIAIIGMAGRFPGAPTLEIFWQNLYDGVESIRFFTDDELRAAGVDEARLSDPLYVKARGFLDDIELFDAAHFGYTPREAELIDPQQRIFLECAWQALENAGYAPTRLPGRASLFAGTSLNSYIVNLFSNPEIVESVGGFQAMLGNDKDFLATRAAYKLDLKGPSVTVQTACSTSLVAVHLACQSLRDGECEIALAGGVSIGIPQATGYHYTEGGIGSPDGHCRAFDAQAKGTVGGSGVGIVVLKRLADALADRDPIRAVIAGSAINNDGSDKVGYTAPSITGQAQVIRAAQAMAGSAPASLGYVETHGTGTPLGDPIEVAALAQVFQADAPAAPASCALGALKPNIGHLDAAAGVAGLIKTVLTLEHGVLPPLLHFQSPNPQLQIERTPFYVPTRPTPWPASAHPRRAGVSSFGIGGTNAHVVLEQAPAPDPAPAPAPGPQLLLISARTPATLEAATDALAAHLADHPELELADVAATLQTGRAPLAQRRFLLAADAPAAAAALAARDPASMRSAVAPGAAPPVVFLFPGQGAQHIGMARALYQHEPRFRAVADDCCERLIPRLGLDLRELLYPPDDERRTTNDEGGPTSDERRATENGSARGDTLHSSLAVRPSSAPYPALDQTWLAQPALFVVEYALAQLWMAWGVRPAALLGHSLGEYVAATLAGVLALDDALDLVAARGRIMQDLPPGSMLSVALGEAELEPWLDDGLALAAINAPELCVVAGPPALVAALEARLRAAQIECRALHTSHAFHSAQMDALLEPFAAQVRQAELRPPALPLLSSVSGRWLAPEQATDPAYWSGQLRAPVRFADALARLGELGAPLLLEVGPGQTLSSLARGQRDAAAVTLATLPHARAAGDAAGELAHVRQTQGWLWLHGVALDWDAVQRGAGRRRLALPTTPFERQRYWIDARPAPAAPPVAPRAGIAESPERGPSEWCWTPTLRQVAPLPSVATADLAARGPWLLLADEGGLAEALLAQIPRGDAPIVLARPGPAFRHDTGSGYQIDPARTSDYTALLRDLALHGALPRTILHLWNVAPTPGDSTAASVAASQALGSQSLLALAQALERQRHVGGLRLLAVSSQTQALGPGEALDPARAPLLAVLTVLGQEYPGIAVRSLDVIAPATEAGRARLAAQILRECADDSPSAQVALRGAQRWVASAAMLDGVRADAEGAGGLRRDGVYVITGGLGRIGRALGLALAQRERVRLGLVQRTPLPARAEWEAWLATRPELDPVSLRIRGVQALEAAGAQVALAQADVTDAAQLRAALAQIEAALGPIAGVIHAAGVINPYIRRPISELTTDEWAAQVRPKADGVLALAQALAGRQLDFCVLQSSLASQLGGLGFAAYAAANRFLDAFAQQRQLADDPIRWISIAWDGWDVPSETGDPLLDRSTILRLIRPDEGAAILLGLIEQPDVAHALVSTSDLPARIAMWVERDAAPATPDAAPGSTSAGTHPRPALSGPYVAPRDATEQALAAIWSQALGIAEVGVYDNFFELGGHSLLATQVISRIRETLGVELPLRALFEDPTIAGLALALAAQPAVSDGFAIERIERVDSDSARELLASIDQISEAGIDALLDTLLAEKEQKP